MWEFRRRLRDDANDTMFWIVIDANSTSAQGVQDDGEGYNEVLIWLSAEDEMWIEGVKYNLLFWGTVILQIHECTNIRKYSEKGNVKGMNKGIKIRNIKHKRTQKK